MKTVIEDCEVEVVAVAVIGWNAKYLTRSDLKFY
jgi:hypothetical protein